MSVVSIPAGLSIGRQAFGEKRFDLNSSNGDIGAQQTRVLAPMRWTCSLVSPSNMSIAQGAVWRSMLFDLAGRINQLAVSDLLMPAPQGNARGTWTTAAAAAAGATSLSLALGAGQAGKSILRGDWIGVNQTTSGRQLLPIAADAIADGSGNVSVALNVPLRIAVASGSAVVWDKPTCLMRRTTDETSWQNQDITQGSFSVDLMESWET